MIIIIVNWGFYFLYVPKLLAKGGAYHRLWQMQAGGFLPVAAIAGDN